MEIIFKIIPMLLCWSNSFLVNKWWGRSWQAVFWEGNLLQLLELPKYVKWTTYALTHLLTSFFLGDPNYFDSGAQCHVDPAQTFWIVLWLWELRGPCPGGQGGGSACVHQPIWQPFCKARSIVSTRAASTPGYRLLLFSINCQISFCPRQCLPLHATSSWWPAQDQDTKLWLISHMVTHPGFVADVEMWVGLRPGDTG